MHPAKKRTRSSDVPATISTAVTTFLPVPAPLSAVCLSDMASSRLANDIQQLVTQLQRLCLEPPQVTASVLEKRKRHCGGPNAEEEKASAQDQVLGTFELLENILIHVDARDILRLQAINSTFQDVYRKSKNLQLKTWERIDAPPSIHHRTVHPEETGPNPLLIQGRENSPDLGFCVHQLACPQGTEVFYITPHDDRAPFLFVSLDDGQQESATEPRESVTELFLFDSSMTVEMRLDSRTTFERGPDHPTRLSAGVRLKNCRVGQVIEIAKTLKASIDWGFAQRGDHDGGVRTLNRVDEDALLTMDPELQKLIVGKVDVRAYSSDKDSRHKEPSGHGMEG
ncbi:hypothetical protein PRZ48_008990 [Zasmidium cellare]|uniref:F-box domain-containing protein n=1 Tax=Zasmidium cellare TaxID=395010 RepID=A0ABR0EI92_ZASCE|nr:hypothetical protein PRZ48_008990 [Zasmidium cellare]